MTPSRIAFIASLVLAAASIVCVILFGAPPDTGAAPMANGFKSPILAFELARSMRDLAFLQGEEAAALRAYIADVQFIDWFFPPAYAGMAATLFAGIALRAEAGLLRRVLAGLAILAALVTIGADWAENEVMNRILADLSAGADPTERLDALQGHTWIKWGLIALYAVLMAALQVLDRRPVLALPPAAAGIAIAATWASNSSGQMAEIMGILLIPFMLTFPVAAVMYLRGKPA